MLEKSYGLKIKLAAIIFSAFLIKGNANAQNVPINSVEGVNFSISAAKSKLLLDGKHSTYIQPGVPNSSAVYLKLKLNKGYNLTSFSLDSRYVFSYSHKGRYITFQPTFFSVIPFKKGAQSGAQVNIMQAITRNSTQVLNFLKPLEADELVVILYATEKTYSQIYLQGAASPDLYRPYLSGVYLTGTPIGEETPISAEGESCEPWTNPINKYDINGDGNVTPLDALRIINYIQAVGNGRVLPACNDHSLKFRVDVNGDGILTPLDALSVINKIAKK